MALESEDKNEKIGSSIRPDAPLLSIILPCFNEEANIPRIYSALKSVCKRYRTEILFVNDGSSDNTESAVQELMKRDERIRLISFLGNKGHQTALRAGLREARGEYLVTMDSDLQHPPELIITMLDIALKGVDVVNTIRTVRQTGFIKNISSKIFYRFFNLISDVPITPESSDFRLISRKVADVLNRLPERNLVLRIIIPHLGFSNENIPLQLGERKYGRRGYSFSKSLKLAYQSIFSFTTFPLDIGFRLGVIIALAGFLYALHAIYYKLFTDLSVPGYTDIFVSVVFLGGIILVYLGILGKYIAEILNHQKQRPEYIKKIQRIEKT